MNLYEKFDRAVVNVDNILSERHRLIERMRTTQEKLDKNSNDLTIAIKERDRLKAMTSVVPAPPRPERRSQHMEEKQAVFTAMRQIPNTWIAPKGLSVLAEVDGEITAAILRHAASIEGIPVEHNGRHGRASMYRWVGNKY
jgi:hypothetical protein